MFVGVSAISKYIEASKKDAYVSTIRSYISAAKSGISTGKYKVRYQMGFYGDSEFESTLVCKLPPVRTNIYKKFTLIPLSIIDVEKKKSPYKKDIKDGFVIILNDGTYDSKTGRVEDKYVYAFAGVDTANNGVYNFVAETDLNRNSIKTSSTLPTSSSLYLFKNNFKGYLSNMNITTMSGTNNDNSGTTYGISGFGTYMLYSICR